MSMTTPVLVDADLTSLRPAVEETLKVTGIQALPQKFNVAAVEPVYDPSQGGFCIPGIVWGSFASASIAAATFGNGVLVSPTGFTFAGVVGNCGITLDRQACRVLGVYMRLNFDAAGLAAFVGKKVRCSLEYRTPDNVTQVAIADTVQTIAAADGTQQNYSFPQIRGIVTSGMALVGGVASLDGTVFPANTTMRAAIVVSRRAAGAQIMS